MMIKQGICAAALLGITTLAFAGGPEVAPVSSGFGGFYAGLGLSSDFADLNSYDSDRSVFADGSIDGEKYSGNFGAEGFNFNLFAGYGWVYRDSFYLGAEVFGGQASLGGSPFQFYVLQNVAGNPFDANRYHSTEPENKLPVRIPFTIGAAFTPGFIVAPGSLFFLKIGFVEGQFRDKFTLKTFPVSIRRTGPKPNLNTWKGGLQLGVGNETRVSQYLSIRSDYTWNHFSSATQITPAQSDPAGNSLNYQVGLKPDAEAFMLSGVYQFSPTDAGPNHFAPPVNPGLQYYVGIAASRDMFFTQYTGNELFSDIDTNALGIEVLFRHDWMVSGAGGQLLAGLGYTFSNRFYLGAEIFGSINNDEGFINYDYTASTFAERFSLQRNNTLGLAVLDGYQVSDAAMIYLRLGVVRSDLSFNARGLYVNGTALIPLEDVYNQHRSFDEYGFQAGVGTDTKFSRHVSLRMEYDATEYPGKMDSIKTAQGGFFNFKDRFSNRMEHSLDNQFILALLYHFYKS